MDWYNCIIYSFDNTNSMIGNVTASLRKYKDLLRLLPLSFNTLVWGKVAKELSVNVEDFVIGIYYQFHRSAK